jgi:hypothetical protein
MVDTEEMYEKMMNRFSWGNAGEPGVYLDENNRRLISVFRRQFARLSKALVLEGDTVRALAAVEKGISIVPPEKMPYDYFSSDLGEALAMAGRKEDAEKMFTAIADNALASLVFISELPENKTYGLDFTISVSLQALLDTYRMATRFDMPELAVRTSGELSKYYGEVPLR